LIGNNLLNVIKGTIVAGKLFPQKTGNLYRTSPNRNGTYHASTLPDRLLTYFGSFQKYCKKWQNHLE
jgi:hypothetical protein